MRTPEDWLRVPMLSRNDLYLNTYPATCNMLTAPLANAIVSSTGGSTGVARTIVLTHQEWDAFCQAQGEAFRRLGGRPDDVVANLFVAGHLWPSFLGVHEMIKYCGGVHLPISSNIGVEEAYKLCCKYQPTVMVSLPTMFVLMADMAKRDGIVFDRLRLIAYAGEQLSREVYQDHLIRFLCNNSAEFNIKYQNLSASCSHPLITLSTDDISHAAGQTKHRFIV